MYYTFYLKKIRESFAKQVISLVYKTVIYKNPIVLHKQPLHILQA